MKTLLLIWTAVCAQAQILSPIIANVVHSGSATFYSRSITVDHAKVPTTDQINFPVLVSGTYTYLKTTGNGGKVAGASGFDIVFGTNNTCASRLDWEIVNWGAATGTVEYWVRIPTLTTATDYVFYVCYGDAAITTDQSNTTGTWNSNAKARFHFPNGSSLSLTDSIGVNNGSNSGLTAGAGKIDGAAVGTGSQSATTGFTGFPALVAARTLSIWVYKTTDNDLGFPAAYGQLTSNQTYGFYVNNLTPTISGFGGGNDSPCSTDIAINTWAYLSVTYDGTTARCYVNGTAAGTFTHAFATVNNASWIAQRDGNFFWNGSLDEYGIWDSALSAGWVTTEYNNQFDPASFYAIGSEVPH